MYVHVYSKAAPLAGRHRLCSYIAIEGAADRNAAIRVATI